MGVLIWISWDFMVANMVFMGFFVVANMDLMGFHGDAIGLFFWIYSIIYIYMLYMYVSWSLKGLNTYYKTHKMGFASWLQDTPKKVDLMISAEILLALIYTKDFQNGWESRGASSRMWSIIIPPSV